MVFRPLSCHDWLAHYRKLFGVRVKQSRHPQDTEDAIQDAALAMLEAHNGNIRDQERYFQRAVSNRAISIHRAQRLRETQTLEDLPEHQHPVTGSPESALQNKQLLALMLDALAELPEPCRIAFVLRQTEGLSNGDIAKRMGVSRNMVERYMMRTTRHLHEKLQPHLEQEFSS